MKLENLKKVFLLETMGWFGNMILLSMVYRSSILSSPFLLTIPFQLSSCLPGQHHAEPPLLVDDFHPQPGQHWRNRKRGKLQTQEQRIEKERIDDSYFGDSRCTHLGTWKHGLTFHILVVWEEYILANNPFPTVQLSFSLVLG